MREALYGEGDPIITGVRRFNALVVALPADSATFRLANPDHWTVENELAAQTVDGLALLNWILLKVYGQGPIPEPVLVPRPGQVAAEPEPKRMSTPEEIARFAGAVGGRIIYAPGKRT